MSTLKKVLALTLALAMVMSLGVFAAFKDQNQIDEDCTDAMELMNALGIMLGDNNGNANPTNTITRAEAATMIFRLMNKGKDDASVYNGMKYFTDVPSGAWFEGYVNYCYTMGIISGRTATTFDPYAPVTGMEIAKMLLCCLKYRTDVEGYTGSNWAVNVQNDAFTAGVLDDYGMALSAPAQRQWVSVMFSSALDSYVVGYDDGEAVEGTKTLGEKQFDYETATGVVTAIGTANLPTTKDGSAKYTTIMTGTDDEGDPVYATFKKLADTSLLGQEVTVYYKDNSTTVYAIKATDDNNVGTALAYEMSVSDGATVPANKYTIGDLTGKLDSNVIIAINNEDCEFETVSKSDFYDKVDNAVKSTAEVTAIDNDDDGDFDVIYCISSLYGEIDITSKGKVSLLSHSYDADEVEDAINYVNDVEDGDFVKATANVFTGLYDIEALEASEGTLTRTTSSSYTIGGTTYKISADALSSASTYLSGAALSDSISFYTDGKYIVYAEAASDSTASTMPDNMAMLIAKGQSENAYNETSYYVKLLTLDGKVTEYEYAQASSKYLAEDAYTEGLVYQYVVDDDDNTVSLKAFSTSKITDSGLLLDKELNATNDTINGKLVSSTAKLFVRENTGTAQAPDWDYYIMTISQFSSTQNVDAQLYTKSSSGITTVIGGGVTFNSDIVEGSTDVDKYVIATGDSYVEYDGSTYYYNKVDVMYLDGTETTLVLAKSKTQMVDAGIDENAMYTVENISSSDIATLSEKVFVTETSTGMKALSGATGSYIQIDTSAELTTLYVLDEDCIVIVRTIDDGDVDSIVVGGNPATLYANTGEDDTYSAITASVLEQVGGSDADKDNVTILYVEVVLN